MTPDDFPTLADWHVLHTIPNARLEHERKTEAATKARGILQLIPPRGCMCAICRHRRRNTQ